MYNVNGKNISIEKLISENYPYSTFLGVDELGKKYSIKKLTNTDNTITSKKESYRTFSSRDLLTSSWYGHEKTHLLKNEISLSLLEKQSEYLLKCGGDYNTLCHGLFQNENEEISQINEYIDGEVMTIDSLRKGNLLLKIIPSVLSSLNKYPHGDLKENNFILHTDKKKFSIIDPSCYFKKYFFTNTIYYPIAPPFFYFPHNEYVTYSDQLALGILFYKVLTNKHPFESYINNPKWETTWGDDLGINPPNIKKLYPYCSTLPKWYKWQGGQYNETEYILSIDLFLEKNTNIKSVIPPIEINPTISKIENELCLKLIKEYLPFQKYIQIVEKYLL